MAEERKKRKKARYDSNIVGQRGEAIFINRILEHEIITSCAFLGEKAEDVDCLCSFKENDKTYSFLVQVKTTTAGYNKKNGNLKVNVPKMKVANLIENNIPTYLAGVDLNFEKVYLMGVFNQKEKINSMPVSNVIYYGNENSGNRGMLLKIKQDVINAWIWRDNSKPKITFNTQIL